MRSCKVFSVVLFFLALIFQVEASPSRVSRKTNGCSKSNIAILDRTVTHKKYFCNWWLSASRTRSPFIELLASEVTAACYCIGTPATNEKHPAAANSVSYKGLHVRQCRATLSAEFSEPWNFCEFYTRATRTSSPFKAFSAPQLLELCDCIEGTTSKTSSKKPKTTSSSSSSTKSSSKTSSIIISSGSSSLTSSSLSSSKSTATDTPITTTTSSIPASSVNNATSTNTVTFSESILASASPPTNITSSTSSATPLNVTTTSGTLVIPTNSATFDSSTSASYSNGINSTVSLDPTTSSNITSSTLVPVNVTSSESLAITLPVPTGFSSGFPTSSDTSGAPYGNGTTTPNIGPTAPISTGSSTFINVTISVPTEIGVPTNIVNTSSAISSGFFSSVSITGAPYGNGTSTPTVGPTAPVSTGNSSSIDSTSSASEIIGVPTGIVNTTSGGFSFSSVATDAPYGNGTSSAPSVGPTAPVTTASSIAINITSSVPASGVNSTISAASTGFSSSVPTSGAPYGNGTSSTITLGPTAPFSTGVFTSSAIAANSTSTSPATAANTTSSLVSSGFSSSTSAGGAPHGNGTSSAPTLNPTAPITTGSANTSTVVYANGTSSAPTSVINSTSAASSSLSSSISTSGAPYGNITGSAPTVGPTAPLPTSILSFSSVVDVSNSSASSFLSLSTFVPSGGISSSAISSSAPYGNSSSTIVSSGPTAPVTISASSTSSSSSSEVSASDGTSTFLPSSTFSIGPVNATTSGSSNGTTPQSVLTTATQSSINATVTGPVTTSASSSASTTASVTVSGSSSSSISQSTTSSTSTSSTSATSSQSSTPSQASNLSGTRVFINGSNLAYGNLALESTQDGENDYATVYTRKQRPTLRYTFNQTSGYLYLGNHESVLSYAIPSFRSDSVQLATLTQDYLTAYPQSWAPLQCTASDAGALSCSAIVGPTRYRRRSVTYSVFVAVPREGRNAADIYLYAPNQIDGSPLGASQVSLMLSKD